jgi:hypothetical protein
MVAHGVATEVAHEAALGAAMVTAFGAAVDTVFTAADVSSARVLASMATVTRGGGAGTIRAIPIIPTRTTAIPTMATRTTVIRTMVIRTMVIRIMVIRITAIRTTAIRTTPIATTKIVMLALPLPRRSRRRSHAAATIAVRLTVHWGRRLATQSDYSRRIKACRLPASSMAG